MYLRTGVFLSLSALVNIATCLSFSNGFSRLENSIYPLDDFLTSENDLLLKQKFSIEFSSVAVDQGIDMDKTKMLAKSGQFVCDYPKSLKQDSCSYVKNDVPSQNDFELETMIGKSKCMQYSDGVWDYEFCPSKHIRQFRAFILNGEAHTEDYILGRFIPLLSKYSVHSHADASTSCPKFFTQNYYDGDFCIQNGKERETQIRYFYQTGIVEPRIVSIVEINLCMYIIKVAVPSLSSKPETEPVHILCHEIATPSQKDEKEHGSISTVFETDDLIDLNKLIWTQKLKAIVSSSDNGFSLLNSAISEINRIEKSVEKDPKNSNFNFQKWIQLLGLEVDKIATSMKDDDEKDEKDDEENSD